MADLLIICRDALQHSILGSLATALDNKAKGVDVEVMFTQEALVALVIKEFRFSPLLEPYRKTMEENARKWGFSTDPFELIETCRKAGITMFGCQAWLDLPGIKGELPPGVITIEKEDVPQRVAKARTILGSF